MGNFFDHIVNRRFRQVYQTLEEMRLIKGKSDLAKKLDTYNHVINNILKGQRNITLDQILKLCHHYGVNANFLFGLDNQMFLNESVADGELPVGSLELLEPMNHGNIMLVPVRAQAGFVLEGIEGVKDELKRFHIPGLEGSNLMAFEIEGDSMLPTITNGDIVVCEEIEPGRPLRDNQVYVVVTDGVVAKRIQQIRDGQNKVVRLRLISDNKDVYPPYEVDVADVRKIYKVKYRLTDFGVN